METTYIFKRIERKYLVDEVTKRRLLQRMKDRLLLDEYGKSTICSLYLDTPDHRIIRSSIDAGAYKEKLRLRSYGTPRADSTVYLELKKKYEGVVYKRRVSLPLSEAKAYLTGAKPPQDSQIWREIDYAMNNCIADFDSYCLQRAQSIVYDVGVSEYYLRYALEMEGYYSDQIDYALEYCGADWDMEAIDAANDYLSDFPDCDYSDLHANLTLAHGFTDDQATQACAAVGK